MAKYEIEVTDTFGGEANYCWVDRVTIEVEEGASDLAIVRRAKAAVGWSGRRCVTSDLGDGFELRPHGICEVMFVRCMY